MRFLLIHDTKSVGFLNGVVLTRVLERRGHTVFPFFGRETLRTQQFWRKTVDSLSVEQYDQVILCCMTFDDVDSDGCIRRLKHLENGTGTRPMILSHRWPDGYERSGYEVIVPPLDLLDTYASDLEPEERGLLRLSLVISREADPAMVPPDEFSFSERLEKAIGQSPEHFWRQLTSDLAKTLQVIRTDEELGRQPQPFELGTIEYEDAYCAMFKLNPALRVHAEKSVQALLRHHYGADDAKVGIGIWNVDDDMRVYVVRGWGSKRPGFDSLLELYADRCYLPPRKYWFGPQDAISIDFKNVGLEATRPGEFKGNLVRFAEFAYRHKYGERRPFAGLARLVHVTATEALNSLDLVKAYTSGSAPSLSFDVSRTRILIELSNRTGELTYTLVLRLLVKTPEAAAFLFKYEGYNLMKLERLLEGVLIGMGKQRSMWLGSLEVPSRLRLDTQISAEVLSNLPQALEDFDEVHTIATAEALQKGILRENSSIARALTRFIPPGRAGLIIYRGSETIGPSVPYALIAGAVAASLAFAKSGEDIEVLDIFSGSGLSAKTILSKQQNWRVFCVDLAISASQADMSEQKNVVWLKTDARHVLSGDEGILNRKFDLACMDPPHNFLIELLFETKGKSGALIDNVKRLAPWLIIYQGHASQLGRGVAIQAALTKRFEKVALWNIGPEVVILAGPATWRDRTFDWILKEVESSLRLHCTEYDWVVASRVA